VRALYRFAGGAAAEIVSAIKEPKLKYSFLPSDYIILSSDLA